MCETCHGVGFIATSINKDVRCPYCGPTREYRYVCEKCGRVDMLKRTAEMDAVCGPPDEVLSCPRCTTSITMPGGTMKLQKAKVIPFPEVSHGATIEG